MVNIYLIEIEIEISVTCIIVDQRIRKIHYIINVPDKLIRCNSTLHVVGVYECLCKDTESISSLIKLFCTMRECEIIDIVDLKSFDHIILAFRSTHLACLCKFTFRSGDNLTCKDSCSLRCGACNNIIIYTCTKVGLRELDSVFVHRACSKDTLEACGDVLGCIGAVVAGRSYNLDAVGYCFINENFECLILTEVTE